MRASAPAKCILFSEHFVVYGEPAIVMAINRRAYVTVEERGDKAIYVKSKNLEASGIFTGEVFKPERGGVEARKILEPIRIAAQTVMDRLGVEGGVNLEVDSRIPVAAGLGSSGAVAVATVAATGKLFGADFTRRDIAQLSFPAEVYVHVTPSGIDQTISTHGGVVIYRKGEGIKPLDVRVEIPLVLGYTGIPRITGDLVSAVRVRKNRFPKTMESIIHSAGCLTMEAVEALKVGDLDKLGELMDICHGLLWAIGVSNDALDRLVYAAKGAGAFGAKLTGAGGGGCIIALSSPKKREAIAKAIQKAGGTSIIAKKTDRGVEAWVSE